jgi:ferredoxin
MKVTVDADKCVASGQCVLAAAEVFDQRGDDGVVILLVEEPESDQYEAARLAAQICPPKIDLFPMGELRGGFNRRARV